MKKMLVFLLFTLFLNISKGQDYFSDFKKYLQSGDTLKQLETLRTWESANPKDPELFTSYFNYYYAKSRKEIVTLSREKPDGKALVFTDSINQKGYIGSQIVYDEALITKGFEKIDKGIELYPDRLDMRFGKVFLLGELKKWDAFTDEIIKTIKYSGINKNQWTWTQNEKQPDGQQFFLSSLQDYQLHLYNTGDNKLLKNMRDIGNEVLKIYPDHIESLSNVALTYLIAGDNNKALPLLLKAEKLNPTDYIVLSNIAQAYKKKGDKQQAIEYYKKTQKYGDEEAKTYATQQIEELSRQ